MKFPCIEVQDSLIISLAKKYKIKELSFFGSILRDDFQQDSDIDILVQFDAEANYSLFDLFEIKEEFEKALGREVDLVEKSGLRNPYRRDNILRNAKVIYAA
jgi:hypothetical protein